MINGRKDKEEDDLLKANRARVKHMFLDDLRPRVLSAKLTEKTAIDSATLATSMWQYLGVDLWEDNPLGRWLWSYPDPKFTNSVLKALNQVLGAHKHREDKFNGILGKLWDKFIEFNVNSEEEDVVYLTSGDIYRLFGIKTKKQKEDALALQADVHTLEDAGSLPERMFHVPESQLRAMRDAFSSQQHLFSEHMNYIDSLLNSVGDDQELPVTSN